MGKIFKKMYNVHIIKEAECLKLISKNDKITVIKYIKNNRIKSLYCDKIVVACDIYGCLKILRPFSNTKTYKNFNKLKKNLQLYLSLNFYFSEELTNEKDHIISLLDQSWNPFIRVYKNKKWISLLNTKKVKNINNKKIKEVWNVAVFDYVKGEKYNKFLRNCNLQEAFEETLYQVKTSKYIKNLRTITGKNFNKVYLGCEAYHYWKNKNGKIYTTHPKFSYRPDTNKYLIDIQPTDMPNNLFLSAYYSKGIQSVSMEESSSAGVRCADKILGEYNKKLPKKFQIVLNKFY